MALETGTYINDLVVTNPTASDKKNQGDDHLRLIKTLLKNSFPNSSRAFRIPEIVSKNANYTVQTTDENKIILCDTSAGAFTLTLPTPTFAGWAVKVVKISGDGNPVYVAPPSGLIDGAYAKIRCNVPIVETNFVWLGSSFYRLRAQGELPPGSILDYFGASPPGYAVAVGQSLSAADHPELFAAWGTVYGGGGGTFNAPNLAERVVAGTGGSYSLGVSGGANSVILAPANLPSINLAHTLGISFAGVTWGFPTRNYAINGGGGAPQQVQDDTSGVPTITVGVSMSGTPTITGNIPLGGSNTAFDNRMPYMAANKMFRLC